jgi:EAL domain-containing protein (putative c-di-GMP-specific phosphodiesterase class I)
MTASGDNRSAGSGWSLCGCEGKLRDTQLPLVALPCRVGRKTSHPICIPLGSVSSTHAEFLLECGQLVVRDLGSTNGTFVNGRRVTDVQTLREGDMVQFADAAFRLTQNRGEEIRSTSHMQDVGDMALALSQFDRLLTERAVSPHYQPIVAASDGQAIAYEVLGRSRLYGLNSPYEMFRAAERLKLEAELSRMLRHEGVAQAAIIGATPHLFVNTHPAELADAPSLITSLRAIRRRHPDQEITLEIHESAVANTATMKMLRAALCDLNMRLAYDDFGAGQSRLCELVEAHPDYLKFDMHLIRGIDEAPVERQKLLAALVKMTGELGIAPLAEGVETQGEAKFCRAIGFDLFQGYFFGRPNRAAMVFGKSTDALEGLLETINVSSADAEFVEKVQRASVSLAT